MVSGFEGIRVIQAAWAFAGPVAGRLLANWGADVICVEHTARKKQMAQKRAFRDAVEKPTVSDVSYETYNLQTNKRSIALNLSLDSGREILYKLLEKSDVFLSNFRPYEIEKFKVEYATLNKLNPRIISAHLTGYGRKGPERNNPAYGSCAGDARSGLLNAMQVPGTEPSKIPGAVADYMTGLSLAFGIASALLIRERTGVGQEVDASIFNTTTWAISSNIAGTLVNGQERRAVIRKEITNPLQNSYQTKDGRWFIITLAQPELYWSRLCKAIGREDLKNDPRFKSSALISKNYLDLFDILNEVFMTKTLDEWKPILNEVKLPWGPLQNFQEVINDPQARANDFFVPFNHPEYGQIELIENPVKLSKTSAVKRAPAPEPGQNTEEVLTEIGYTTENIKRFREEGAIA